jgi:molybdenum cofactor cytidylyltransferase
VSQIGLVILAAGGSVRLGSPKQLLQFEGRTLLRRAAETALASACKPIVVVLGDRVELLEAQLRDLPVRVARNPNWASGMGSSIQVGLHRLLTDRRDQIEGAVFMVCDQPLIRSSDIDRLCFSFVETGCGVISSAYDGTNGVPVLFGAKYFSELENLPPNEGARRLIGRHSEDHHSVSLPLAAFDVDTSADYERLIEKAGSEEGRSAD